MLFNSYIFILVFLPVTLAGYFIVGRIASGFWVKTWLVVSSAVFYGWWSIPFLGLLMASIVVNFFIGRLLQLSGPSRSARLLMIGGIVANLGILAYFKYYAFIVENVATLTGLYFAIHAVVLPLAISFYTFQQITYLVDSRNGLVDDHSILDYVLFVSFFPQLIAGPIVHHSEMIPQFRRKAFRFQHSYFAAGVAFFVMGLVKKVVIADPVSDVAGAVFDDGPVRSFGLTEAWLGVLAATVGIYFDFSGYSDMAVGMARMFGIRLPYNFDSPYRATSIIDFWRRWHITLSRFLRDYVYIPLGGNRLGEARRGTNLMITMLVGGLWHGAGWTFVVWGGLHGVYLLVNRLWHAAQQRLSASGKKIAVPTPVARFLTLAAVMFAWIFFYASSFEQAIEVIRGLVGMNGASTMFAGDVMESLSQPSRRTDTAAKILVLFLGLALALFAPNTQQIIDGKIATTSRNHLLALFAWRPNPAWAAITVVVVLFTLTQMSTVKAFIYFQF